MSPEAAGAGQADFGRTYWRSAPAVAMPLPPLGADAIDDATFRLLADNLPTLAWVANGDGYIVWYNRRWHEYCGTTPAEMEGWGWTSTHDPELLPSVLERWTASIATGEPFEMTFPLRGADGVFRPFLTRIQPVRDGTGVVARWFGVNTEIFDQVAAEAALRAERDRGRDVLDSMAEGFVLLDRAFRILDINAEGLRLDRRPRAEIVGRTHWEVWPGTEDSDLGRLYKRAVAEHVPLAIENRYVWPDGREAWMEVRGYPTAEGLAVFYRDVTERKRAQAALRASEARLGFLDRLGAATAALGDADAVLAATTRLLGEHLRLSVCAYADMDEDQDGFTIRGDWAAPGSTSIVGHYSLADFGRLAVANLGAGLPLVVNDNLAELAPEEAATFLAIGIRATICMPLVKDGRLAALMAIHDRVPRAWTAEERDLLHEVTSRSWAHVERVAAAAELRRSEERYRTLFGAIEAGFCVVEVRLDAPDGSPGGRVDYRVVEANPAFYAQTGFPGAILGRWLREAAPQLEEHWYETYGRVAATGEPARFEQGSAALGRWFDVYAFRQGEPDEGRVAILFNDISARRTAEERLRELNDTLEAQVAERTAERDRTWALSRDLQAVVEADGTFQAVNPAWLTVLGLDPDALVGRRFLDFLHPDDVAESLKALPDAVGGRVPTFENRYPDKDGTIHWISWVVAPEGARIYASGRDVTEQKVQAAALAQAEEALRQAQKMEAVGQLTGGLAHDFNNMLAAIIGSLDLLGRRLGTDDARARRYADAAMEGARRAALLTQRLLAFSRQQPLRPEPIAVNRLVAGMSELIRGSIGSDVRLETVLASGLWRAQADPNQLENAILNLAVNARDAMPEGGRLTIETQNAHLDDRYAAANGGVPAGQYVLVAVTDTGTGMPPEVMARAFDPFFTTKEVGRGTGLGLSQVYGFVRQSGGHVKIYSEPGQGTSVKVYLPRLLGGPADEPDGAAAPGLPLGDGQEVILVVEDEPAVRRISVDALTDLGYRVLEAEGAAAALRLLDQHPEVALLFTDVVMPDLDGRRLAEEARRRRPGLRVLFTTGYTRNAVVHNGVLDPGVDLVGKPFTVEDLAAKVREVLDRPPVTRPVTGRAPG